MIFDTDDLNDLPDWPVGAVFVVGCLATNDVTSLATATGYAHAAGDVTQSRLSLEFGDSGDAFGRTTQRAEASD